MSENENVSGGDGESGENICGYPVHPAASAYPLMIGKDFDELVASVQASMKMDEPVVLKEGVLLDGRNRLRAKEVVENRTGGRVQCEMKEFDPAWGNEIDWIENRNGHRRHLTPDQKAFIAKELHGLREEEKAKERQEQSRFGSNIEGKKGTHTATPDLVSPLKTAESTKASCDSTGKIKVRKRNPTSAQIIAAKAGAGVTKHQIEDLRSIEKSMGAEALMDIRDGKKTIREVKKTITPAKPKVEAPFEEKVKQGWERLKKTFAITELPDVRKAVLKVVKQEIADVEGKGG